MECKKVPWKKIIRYRGIYLMILPVLLYFIVFSVYPLLLGILSSFQNVKLMGNSEFVGLKNYISIFRDRQFRQAFVNSLVIGLGTFAFQFVWGLLIALLLNEVRQKVFKSFFQTVTFIPYLLSWSVVGGLWITILSPTGMVNAILRLIRGSAFVPVVFMSEARYGRAVMIFTGAWKNSGYYAAMFLAAIVAIDRSLYEAALIDGATRLQQITRVTIPMIVPTMKVVAVLSIMGVLRNFDQIFIMGNASINSEVQNLLVLIYEKGILQFQVGTANAAATMVLAATYLITTAVKKLLHYDRLYG